MIYRICVTIEFEVMGVGIAITDQGEHALGYDTLEIEETRKNGQEDCHMSGSLVKEDSGWRWSEQYGDGGDSFITYHSKALYDAIPCFLDDNPPPELI